MGRFQPFLIIALSIVVALSAHAKDVYTKIESDYHRLGLRAAVDSYAPASQKGDSSASFAIGTLYLLEAAALQARPNFDKAVVHSREESAIHWYKVAARNGSAKGQKMVDLASKYDIGALYLEVRYIANDTKPPPENDVERYTKRMPR